LTYFLHADNITCIPLFDACGQPVTAPTVQVELKIVEQNMKTPKLSETDALARQEKYKETIRTTSGTLKVGGDYID
jgi:hypothetical protein